MADEVETRMSEPKFTPGPWKWDDHGDLRGQMRNAVINPNLRGDVLSGINREADARLIAAAPELYEALENLAGDVYLYSLAGDADGHEIPWESVLKTQGEALAALAKARGEA